MRLKTLAVLVPIALCGATLAAQQQEAFRFRTNVELVNVTATVTDTGGRFVSGLRKEDFELFEDGRAQPISHFNADRVPVSLGIVLDTSGSMDGQKMAAARRALDRFLFELLDPADEIFLYRFDENPELVQGWTTDRQQISQALGRLRATGGTAMYDAAAEAVRIAETGRHRKKAVVIISDGNDTSSQTAVGELKQLIRETEVLVYAIAIDNQASRPFTISREQRAPLTFQRPPRRPPIPLPFPIPGGRRPPTFPPTRPAPPKPAPPTPTPPSSSSARTGRYSPANVAALREITDDSGGRTEIIRSASDLEPATAGIADELSRQYFLGYVAAAPKDGRWHSIEVRVRNRSYHVRARRGYVATP
jgi:VWFA-related protein